MGIRHQLYLSKVFLIHLSGQLFLWIYKGAMPVPKKPGLSNRAIQVLQTETRKWNLKKKELINYPVPCWCSFCSRQCKYIPIKGQQWSTGNSLCSKHDSFIWPGISWLLQRPINSSSTEGNGRFAIAFNGMLAAPLALCANRFFKHHSWPWKLCIVAEISQNTRFIFLPCARIFFCFCSTVAIHPNSYYYANFNILFLICSNLIPFWTLLKLCFA